MNNQQTIFEIYKAFGRGDIPAILEKLSDWVEWDYSGSSNEVPWLMYRRGKEEVADYFSAVSELEFNNFIPKEILAGKNVVVAILDIDSTYKPNGKIYAEKDAIHIWRFNSEGKVVSFRHCVDTYQHHVVYGSENATSSSASVF